MVKHSPCMPDPPRRHRTVFVLGMILLVAMLLRLWSIGGQSLWFDEALGVQIARQPTIPALLKLVRDREQIPPLHHVVLHGWMRIFGASESSVRLPSALAGGGSVVALFLLVRRMYDTRAGLIAASLLAVNAFHISYSQEARTYALFMFLALLSSLMSLRLWDRWTAQNQCIYVLLSALLLYSHLYGVFVVLAQNISFAFLLRHETEKWIRIKRWMLLQLAIAACFAPYVPTVWEWTRGVSQGFWIKSFSLSFILITLREYAGSTALLALLGAVSLLGLWRLPGLPRKILLSGLLILPVVVPILLSILTRPIFVPRYGIPAIIGMCALAGAGIASIPHRAARGLIWILILGLTLPGAVDPSGRIIPRTERAAEIAIGRPQKQKSDWQAVGHLLQSRPAPGDVVVLNGRLLRFLYDYYVTRRDLTVKGFDGGGLPIGLPLPGNAHLWLVLQNAGVTSEEIAARTGLIQVFRIKIDDIDITEFAPAQDQTITPSE